MIRVSTKFKEMILGPTSFESIFNGGRILVYSGAQPSSADNPPNGTLLGQITAGGVAWLADGAAGGLRFTRSGAYCIKDPDQSWIMTEGTVGVAGWFRLVGPSPDAGHLTYNLPRLDGSCNSVVGADFFVANGTFLVGRTVPIQQFVYTLPPIL